MLSIAEKPDLGSPEDACPPPASLVDVKLRRRPVEAAQPVSVVGAFDAPDVISEPEIDAGTRDPWMPVPEAGPAPEQRFEPPADDDAQSAQDDQQATPDEADNVAEGRIDPSSAEEMSDLAPAPSQVEPVAVDPWMPAPEEDRAADTSGEPPADDHAQTVPDTSPAIALAQGAEDLIEYWATRLSAEDRLPREIDFETVSQQWRNVFLFSLIGSRRKPVVELKAKGKVDLPRLMSGGMGPDEGVLVWTIELARKAVATGRPIHKVMTIQGAEDAPLGLVVLPLADNGTDVSHVLCHLHETTGATQAPV